MNKLVRRQFLRGLLAIGAAAACGKQAVAAVRAMLPRRRASLTIAQITNATYDGWRSQQVLSTHAMLQHLEKHGAIRRVTGPAIEFPLEFKKNEG